jgi:hypothetical protein
MTVAGICSSSSAADSALASEEVNCAEFCSWISSRDFEDG